MDVKTEIALLKQEMENLKEDHAREIEDIKEENAREIAALRKEVSSIRRALIAVLKWKRLASRAALVWGSVCLGALGAGYYVTGNKEKAMELFTSIIPLAR